MQTGGIGAFVALGQTARGWYGMTALGTNVYASVNNGDIYMQTGGVGAFVALGQTARGWIGMTALGANVYACVNNGDIYKINTLVSGRDVDRSVKDFSLDVIGTLTKSAVATGSQLVAYSGFSNANYLEQPYSANLDYGTDFNASVWIKPTNTASTLLSRAPATLALNSFNLNLASGIVQLGRSLAGAAFVNTSFGYTPALNAWTQLQLVKRSNVFYLYANGVQVATTIADTNSYVNATAVFTVGTDNTHTVPFSGSLCLLRSSATAPSADQVAYIFETERKMFEPGAQVTLAGTSTAVTCLNYDEVTDSLHAGTSYGRSAFKGLVRTESEATTNGAPRSYSSYEGTLIQAGATGSKVYIPAKAIRDELNRSAEQKKAFGQELVSQDFTATASQTAFVLPLGFVPKFTYQQGLLKKQATGAGFWTSAYDGFRYTVTLATGATLNDVVSILCTRGN